MDKIIYSEKDKLIFDKLSKQGPLGKRALFIFQYLFLRKEFRELVIKIRKALNIPENGFNPYNSEDVKIFLNKSVLKDSFDGECIRLPHIYLASNKIDIYKELDNYIEQCGILVYAPNLYLADNFVKAIIKEYVLFNDFIGLYKGQFALTSIPTYDPDPEYLEPKELRFEIPISAKKEEVIDYINKAWDSIEFARTDILKKKDLVRFRVRKNFIRDIAIFNKYIEIENLSSKQRKEKGIKYIEMEVLKELKEEGIKNLPDEGTVRSIVSRLRNEIKDKNAYWENLPEETSQINDKPLELPDFG